MRALLVAVLVLVSVGCTSEMEGGGAAPAAPAGLVVTVQMGGAHIVWQDLSSNETEFVIERAGASGAFAEIARQPFDVKIHHDATVSSGETYRYRVAAENAVGISAYTDVVTFEMP